MNRAQAIAKLRPILGKTMAYREDPKALVGAERVAMQQTAREKNVESKALEAARDARRALVLKADAEYQDLRTRAEAARKAFEQASYYAHHDRISVGVNGSMFFSVRASGENWADVVEKLTRAKATQS